MDFLHFIPGLSREKGYLRFSKLRLNGFKSFVDSTDLVISDGLTGVVGPNGCGKSNLLEALRWVMGENRPKAMRGSGMDDVIFSGAASRPAKNFAEVALKIDNSDRSAPAEYDQFSEFEVVRRIARDSGSAYKVNSKDARARDVQMLFADASTGAHSPALVRQGQIAELINAKPKSRRRILEEAAGISGLYQRRHEAELKLSGADTNLSRLDDTIEQLASQLGHLAKQAKQAVRYREIGEELRKLEGQLLYIKWKEAESIRVSAELEKEKSQLRASEVETEAKKFLNEREVLEDTLPQLREDNSNFAKKLQDLLVQREFLVNSEKQILQDISKLQADIDQLEFDIIRETSLNQDAVETLKRLEIEKAELALVGENYSSRLEAAIEDSRVSALDLQGLELRLSNQTEDNARLMAQHQSAEGLYEELKATLVRIISEEKKANIELEASRIIVASESLKATEAKDKFRDAKIEFELADSQLEKINLSRNDVQSKEAKARAISSEAEGIETALRAESGAVSRLLDRETSEIKQIIDRIKVKPGYELALGAAFQDDLKNPEIEKDVGTGWINLKPDYPAQNLPGDVEPLSSFVSGPELLSRRITQIGVVSNKLGAKLQSQLMPGQRLVSKEGACWRWDGFKVEAVDASTSSALRLQQLNRLEELKQELEQAISKSLGSRQAHASLQAELLELTNFDQETRLTRQNADKIMTELNRVMSSAESEKSIAEGKVENLLLTVARYKNDSDNIQKRLLEAEKAINNLGDLKFARNELEKLKEEVIVSRTTMISKRGVAESIRTENEIRVQRLKEIDEHFLVWVSRREFAEDRIKELKSRRVILEEKLKVSEKKPNELVLEQDQLQEKIHSSEVFAHDVAEQLKTAEGLLRQALESERTSERVASEAREDRARNEVLLESALSNVVVCLKKIKDEYDTSPELLRSDLQLDSENTTESWKLEEKVDRLKRQRDNLGAVNLRAEEDAKEVQEQYDFIKGEKDELTEAIKKLRSGIASLNKEGRERILTAFEQVNENFSNLFKHLFNGGDGKLVMVESDDPLDAGLEIMCQPPGKKLSTLSLLSGGEQTLTALALIFAVFLANPAPLCVLDEVDAPLDDANVTRFCDLLDEMNRRTNTRFLIITHHAVTMSRMDRLFGVTMGELGVSQLVSVDLKRAEALVA